MARTDKIIDGFMSEDKYDIIDFHEEKFNICSGWLSKANDCLSS